MKLTDYVVEFLVDQGIDTVFGLTGGAVVHLFDSADRNPGMQTIFCHHEQAAALAAQAYARVRNNPGAAVITTGPGGTNALTGVAAAWLDSVPCIYISGQARLAHTTRGKAIRQLGSQQMDIVTLVSPITKYAIMIDDPAMIRYHLQKALHIATTGRPGPVWIDLPMDLQWASIDPGTLPSFHPGSAAPMSPEFTLKQHVRRCCELLLKAERPIILAGHGVRLAHAESEFKRALEALRFPFLSTWNASDILSTDHELYVGRPGVFGQRGANLAIQNCDLLLSIGSHLCLSLTGTLYEAFAREATIVMVDVDWDELEHRTVRVDLAVKCDAKIFLKELLSRLSPGRLPDIGPWRKQCTRYKTNYNMIHKERHGHCKSVDSYVFIDMLSDELNERDIVVVDGGGTINQITFQSFRAREGQRIIISAGLCAMGSGLPESIGACFAGGNRRTICLCGDGGLQLNIQELQTLVHHNLPVKIFVLNNGGYLSIRNTQDGFLESNYVGSCSSGGLSLPDFTRVASAYGIKACRAEHHWELRQKIQETLQADGPALCEVMVSKHQQIAPRQAFEKNADGTFVPRPLEDMEPLLELDEFLDNMVVRPWKESPSRATDLDMPELRPVS